MFVCSAISIHCGFNQSVVYGERFVSQLFILKGVNSCLVILGSLVRFFFSVIPIVKNFVIPTILFASGFMSLTDEPRANPRPDNSIVY